jgi:coenzyme Q-binding protein COQ10
MPRHSETKHLPYTPAQLFTLVGDVGRYAEFLPWVVAVRVRSSSETETIADLVVGFNAFKERFTSRVTKQAPDRITVDYIEGPLKYLKNEWRFEPAPPIFTEAATAVRARKAPPEAGPRYGLRQRNNDCR